MTVQKWRILLAFFIAPISAPTVVSAVSIISGQTMFIEFYMKIGAIVGYGVAFILGLPYYYFVIREANAISLKLFAIPTILFSSAYFLIMGLIMVFQDGIEALTSSTYLGYGAIFVTAVSVSVICFYFIAFFGVDE